MKNQVQFNQNSLIKINARMIEELKEKAKESENGRYRLCLQHSPQDKLHEMFIVRSKDDYGRPDKHEHTTESHTIIDGEMLVVLFEDDGRLKEVFKLSKEDWHTYRIDVNTYHMQIPLTEQVVYYEVKLGPFTEETNIYPQWAPDTRDQKEAAEFLKTLKERIQEYMADKNGQ